MLQLSSPNKIMPSSYKDKYILVSCLNKTWLYYKIPLKFIMHQTEYSLVPKRKENFEYNHIPVDMTLRLI